MPADYISLYTPGAADRKGADGREKSLKELNIFTETVAVDAGMVREFGETDMI